MRANLHRTYDDGLVPAAGPERRDGEVTFNVLFTPGTPERLLPFALSLLQSPGARLRLVSNGCGPQERELLRAVVESDARLSHYTLPGRSPIEHGPALNHLFEAFPEAYFAIADSDVIARGDWLSGLLPMAPDQAAVFSGTPVWLTGSETVLRPGTSFFRGLQNVLEDGTVVGSTFVAVYERAAVEEQWSRLPRGMETVHERAVPAETRAAMRARGWGFTIFDTCRLLNLELMLAGYALENRDPPQLHHVGSYSARAFEARLAFRRRELSTLRSDAGHRLRRIWDAAMLSYYRRRRPASERMNLRERRHAVIAYVDSVIDAVLAGDPPPPQPRTDSEEVDRRVAALATALELHYPPGASMVREARGRSGTSASRAD
jgi:hypothetical protein